MKKKYSKFNVAFNRPVLRGREIEYIQEAIKLGHLAGDGHFTDKCNQLIKKLTGSKFSLLTHSCTAALEMAAILCDLRPGDEVIMPSYTFVSTANAVVLRGAVPVFVDVNKLTLNLDYREVRKAITDKTKAVFAVHYGGFIADMDFIGEICRDKNIFLVEDAAQALGSSFRNKLAGSFGDMAAFSFHQTKNIISGEGGALTINNSNLHERAEIIRQKGTNKNQFLNGIADKYTWVDIGSSFLPGELTSSFLYAQLQKHNVIKEERLSIFKKYKESLKDLEKINKIELINQQKDRLGNGHLFYILMNSKIDRLNFIEHMKSNNINCPFHYIPLHSSPAGLKYGRSIGEMKITNDIASRLVRLPIHSGMLGKGVLDYVISKIFEYVYK